MGPGRAVGIGIRSGRGDAFLFGFDDGMVFHSDGVLFCGSFWVGLLGALDGIRKVIACTFALVRGSWRHWKWVLVGGKEGKGKELCSTLKDILTIVNEMFDR